MEPAGLAGIQELWCRVTGQEIDLIHDTRHLCTRFRIDGIKAMSRGISGDKQVIAFASTSYPVEVFLYSHKTRRRFNSYAKSGALFESRYVKAHKMSNLASPDVT